MPVARQLSTLLYHVGVALTAIVPRLPNDRPFPFSIGGDLSFNFRRVMLGLVLSNAIRIFCFEDSRFITGESNIDPSWVVRLDALIFHVFKALESFLRSFLCLLTPYLMQCQLQNRINISEPGRDLMFWVYLVVLFNILGCVMVEATNDTRYWCIKEFGDALSFPPVYKTLKLYSSIISQGGRYPGRGDMTVQTLLIVEYLAVTATFLSAVGFVQMKDVAQPMYEAFRHLGAYANLTRLLCHAMLMNSKDEAEYMEKYTTTMGSENDTDAGRDTAKKGSLSLIRSL